MSTHSPSTRKRRRDEFEETDSYKYYDGFMDDDSEPHKFGTSVLPVADLPDSFSGVPQDGMEYLFTVRQEERRLPLVTRVPNPYSLDDTSKTSKNASASTGEFRSTLPTEEWRTCFEERFRNFRANIRQPTIHISIPRPATSAPRIPNMRERDQWWAFFRGDIDWEDVPSSQFHTNKHGSNKGTRNKVVDYDEAPPKGKLRGWVVYDEQLSWEQPDEDGSAGDNVTDHSVHDTLQDKQAPGDARSSDIDQSSYKDKGKQVAVANALPTPRGSPKAQAVSFVTTTPREPTRELLRLLDQKVTLHLLKYFTHWIQGHFDRSFLPAPPPLSKVHSQSGHPEKQQYNFTPSHGRWMFALLSWLDTQLTSEEISVLRNLARQVMKVIKEESLPKDPPCTSKRSHIGEVGCWMIVAAVASGWGQKDMWIDAEVALQ